MSSAEQIWESEYTFAPQNNAGSREKNLPFVLNATVPMCRPVLSLSGPQKASLAVRCCPVLFQLRKVPRKKASTAEETAKNDQNKEMEEWENYETVFWFVPQLPLNLMLAVFST